MRPVDPATAAATAALEARLRSAEAALDRGEATVARDAARHAAAEARQGPDPGLLGWALMVLGRAEIRVDRILAAHVAADEAYSLLGACGDVPRQLWALNTCATVHVLCGDTLRSVELWRKGVAASARPDCQAVRSVLLINLSNRLRDAGEFAEAIACRIEAMEAARRPPEVPGLWLDAASRLASLRTTYAEALLEQGRPEDAAQQRQAAAEGLPAIDPQSWRSLPQAGRMALLSQTRVLAALGRIGPARQAAAAALRVTRGTGPVTRAYGMAAVAALHRCSGQLQRAVAYENRILLVWRSLGNTAEIVLSLERLAGLHAAMDDYAMAVRCSSEMNRLRGEQHMQNNALRCRLAALERQADRRRYQNQEARVHTQRLAIIGRLIGQTHHALSGPLQRVHVLTQQALQADATARRAALEELSLTIDRAANLVSQLKLFSYRSTPQPTVLSLTDALIEAWRGLAHHVGPRLVEMQIDDAAVPPVWADAQRLGIMFKVLLIELTEHVGRRRAPALLRAVTSAGPGNTVQLHIEGKGIRNPAAGDDGEPTLGATLCMEIAGEMGGRLQAARDTRGVLRFGLQLPGADDLRPMLPTSVR